MADKWFFDSLVLSAKIWECAEEKFRYYVGARESLMTRFY